MNWCIVYTSVIITRGTPGVNTRNLLLFPFVLLLYRFPRLFLIIHTLPYPFISPLFTHYKHTFSSRVLSPVLLWWVRRQSRPNAPRKLDIFSGDIAPSQLERLLYISAIYNFIPPSETKWYSNLMFGTNCCHATLIPPNKGFHRQKIILTYDLKTFRGPFLGNKVKKTGHTLLVV